jgi:regulator of sirC expression with transglutaminase-like and TPR domain
VASHAELTLWGHVVKRPDADLDLGQAALLVAEADREIDVAHWLGVLDELGARAASVVGAAPRSDGENQAALRRLLQLLYGELGFRGNSQEYYDPRNSWLDQVLERRTGIPITLAVVLLEVARRGGVSLRGVSFPSHFLVRAPGPLFVDPFEGKVVGAPELRALHLRATGEDRDPDPRLLEPCDKQQLLIRMLNNLRAIWEQRGERERLQGVQARIDILKGALVLPRGSSLKS